MKNIFYTNNFGILILCTFLNFFLLFHWNSIPPQAKVISLVTRVLLTPKSFFPATRKWNEPFHAQSWNVFFLNSYYHL